MKFLICLRLNCYVEDITTLAYQGSLYVYSSAHWALPYVADCLACFFCFSLLDLFFFSLLHEVLNVHIQLINIYPLFVSFLDKDRFFLICQNSVCKRNLNQSLKFRRKHSFHND